MPAPFTSPTEPAASLARPPPSPSLAALPGAQLAPWQTVSGWGGRFSIRQNDPPAAMAKTLRSPRGAACPPAGARGPPPSGDCPVHAAPFRPSSTPARRRPLAPPAVAPSGSASGTSQHGARPGAGHPAVTQRAPRGRGGRFPIRQNVHACARSGRYARPAGLRACLRRRPAERLLRPLSGSRPLAGHAAPSARTRTPAARKSRAARSHLGAFHRCDRSDRHDHAL